MAKKSAARRLNSKSSRPLGVKVISVLMYVISVFVLLSGLVFIFAGSTFPSSEEAQATALKFFEDFTGSTTISANILESFSSTLIVVGIISILVAVLFFFIARGLWNGKSWARILAIIFFTLGFIGALADILRGDFAGNIPQLIIDGLIAGYLLFNKEVQRSFSK